MWSRSLESICGIGVQQMPEAGSGREAGRKKREAGRKKPEAGRVRSRSQKYARKNIIEVCHNSRKPHALESNGQAETHGNPRQRAAGGPCAILI